MTSNKSTWQMKLLRDFNIHSPERSNQIILWIKLKGHNNLQGKKLIKPSVKTIKSRISTNYAVRT